MDINTYLWIVLIAGSVALLFALIKTNWINKQDQGTDKMEQIGMNFKFFCINCCFASRFCKCRSSRF